MNHITVFRYSFSSSSAVRNARNKPLSDRIVDNDKNKRDDYHIVEGTAEAAFLGPCRVMKMGHGATVPG
jgi:hypothetical protein